MARKAFIFGREGSGFRLAANFGFSSDFKEYLERDVLAADADPALLEQHLPIADTLLARQQDEAVRLRDFLGERP